MTISILGCGWLGLPLGQALVQKGYKVKGSTTTPNKLNSISDSGIHPYRIKISDRVEGDVNDFFSTDILFVNIPPRRIPEIETLYPLQIKVCIEQALKSGVKNIVFISSTSVYSNIGRMVKEEDAIYADKPSGRALLEAEYILKKEPAISSTIIRFGGLIGADRNPAMSISRKLKLENAQAPVNLIYIDDCIQIICKIIELGKWGYIFNACAPKHPAKIEVYRHAANQLNVSLPEISNSTTEGFKIIDSSFLISELEYCFIYDDPMLMF